MHPRTGKPLVDSVDIRASEDEPESSLQFTCDASFDEETLAAVGTGEKGPVKFDLVVYNGGKMKPSGRKRPVAINLAGITYDTPTPVFLDHNKQGRDIVGHSFPLVDGGLRASGQVSGVSSAADTVVMSAKQGFPWKVSMGAEIKSKPVVVPAGERRSVNGQLLAGPFDYIDKVHMHEISFVPIAADKTTSAAIAARSKTMDDEHGNDDAVKKEEENTKKVEARRLDPDFGGWLKSQGLEAEDLDDKTISVLQASYKVQNENANDEITAASRDEIRSNLQRETAAEILRQKEIRKLTAFDAELQAKAIQGGWTPQQTELEMLRGEMRRAPHSTSRGSRSLQQLDANAIEAAICMQTGTDAAWLDASADHWKQPGRHQIKGYSEQDLDAASDAGEYTFGRLFREYLHANAISFPPGATTSELIPMVKNAHRQLLAAGGSTGMSSISIAGILSNVMGKRMLSSFDSVRPVAQRISSSRSVSDFKETKAFRLTGNGDFLPVGDGGELQSMQLQEESYANRPDTFGRLIQVSRKMLINDDLGALTGVTRILGRKAALKLQSEFFTVWVNLETFSEPNSGNMFFSAGNGNLITTELSIPGLTEGEAAFLSLEDADGDPIDVMPETLLVPQSLKVTAEEHMTSTTAMVWDRDTAATATNRWPTTNPHVGKWNIEWSPWLEKLAPSNGATSWYLVGPRNVVAAAEIVYLNGRTSPIIEGEDSDFAVLGFQWRAYYDFGVAPQDYRGAVKSNGTVAPAGQSAMLLGSGGPMPPGNPGPAPTAKAPSSRKAKD